MKILVEEGTLHQAAAEIRQLRAANNILQAQMYVVDVFAQAVGMRQAGLGASQDVAWEIDRTIEDYKKELMSARAKTEDET